MRLDEGTGIVSEADWIPSPNCDDRPPGITVDTLVIHAISLPPDSFGGGHVARLFTNHLDPDAHPYFAGIWHLRVSAHFFIDRQGALTQFVPVGKRAWHAGESRFRGRDAVNDFSIGVELEGCDSRPFEDIQYTVLTTLTSTLMSAYPALTPDRIMGHSDIAPKRKTDPGPGFDWRRFLGELGS